MTQTRKRRLRPIRSMTILTILAGLFMVAEPNADAIPLVPTDLNPGDTYHLVYLASTTIDATSPNIADYDKHAQDEANAAGGGLDLITKLVITSTGSEAAVTHVAPSAPVYELDNYRLADNTAEEIDGKLIAGFDIDKRSTDIRCLHEKSERANQGKIECTSIDSIPQYRSYFTRAT